ncbi:methyltransferase [Parendozoicomonas haliclonae]|uniref:tRNA (guanine(46)-N(7))-methyltransferase n=1 Tax=Parendozoicomonas haliclonae TaxID=1960125 RepID=A0A1X7AK27_9GAMM|nr:methyltransferase [Parendozoicomonas haliclonae]SMA46700.1 tRNA (guanine-N(7)-)-methyltransferase [Parendozoicomonas haliclonae]
MDLTSIQLFLLVAPVLAAMWLVAISIRNGIGPMPSSRPVTKALKLLLPEKVNGSIIELGCGWGRVAMQLARHYPGNQVLAVENNFPVWLVCWLRVRFSGLRNIRVVYGDIYQFDLTNAGLVYCYLFTGAMQRLGDLFQEGRNELTLISSTFALPDREASNIVEAQDLWRSRLYCYELPAAQSLN